MINILNELNKIKKHIDDNYDVQSEVRKSYLNEYMLIVAANKYDIKIQISYPNLNSYIPNDYGLYLGYDANKKYRSELCYAGGGHMIKYVPNEYSEIDSYLENEKFDIKKKAEKQTSIFDFI